MTPSYPVNHAKAVFSDLLVTFFYVRSGILTFVEH